MVCLIVHKQESSVLHTSALHIMELQRCLQWHIGALLLGAYKLAAILMQSSDKELCLVVACYGETRQSLPHVRLKPAAIGTLQVGCLRSKRIIIERCGDIGIVDVLVVEIHLGIHQPLRIAEHRDTYLGIGGSQSVELGKRKVQLRRTTCVEHHHILLGRDKRLGKHSLRRLKICDAVSYAHSLQPLRKAEVKMPLLLVVSLQSTITT